MRLLCRSRGSLLAMTGGMKGVMFVTVFLMGFVVGLPLVQATTGNASVVSEPEDASWWVTAGQQADSSFAVTQFSLKDDDGDDSLKSVVFTTVAGSPAITAGDIDWTAIYKDDGDGRFTAGSDTQLATTTPNIGAGTTITVNDSLTSSASTYFIVFKLTTGATDGNKFKVSVAANGLTDGADGTITTNALVGMTNYMVDSTAPVVANTYPTDGATGVPLGSFISAQFTDAGGMSPMTINPGNVTFTKDGSAVPFSIRAFEDGFDLLPSAAPTYADSARWAKPWSATNAFADFMYNETVSFDSNVSFTAGDIVMYQNDNFPPEFGVITNTTLTGGTFEISGWPPMGPMRIIKLATPDATGTATSGDSITKGDLLLINTTANPDTSYKYSWVVATTGGTTTNGTLRVNGNASAPTYDSGSIYSKLTPDTTATDNGATADGVLAVSVGDMVYAKLAGGSYAWHIATGVGNVSSDSGEGTAQLDGLSAGNSLVVASSQMSKLSPQAQGAVTASTNLSTGDVIFTNVTAGASNIGAYNWHFASIGGAVDSSDLRLDNAPAKLQSSSNYTIAIGTGVTDLAGNALSATSTASFTTGSHSADNVQMPPIIQGSFPDPGSTTFSPNGNLIVNFPDGDSGDMSITGAGDITSTNNILLQVASNGAPTGSNLCADSGCVITWDSSSRQLKINPATNLNASTEYILTVKNTITNSSGLTLAGPDYFVAFKTTGGADETKPTVQEMDPKNGGTNVIRNIPSILLQFSEPMDVSTVNTDNILFWQDSDKGSDKDGAEYTPSISVVYDAPAYAVHIGVKEILQKNEQYCVQAGTGLQDTAGLAVNQNIIKCFTTVDAEFTASAPTVMFADADTFNMWIEFDMPVDFSSGPFGAINKQNFAIENPVGTSLNLNDATFSARPETRAVEVSGLSLEPETEFKVTVTNVKDVSGNEMIVANGTTNVAQGTVIDPTQHGAFIGGFDAPDFDQKDFGDFAMSPERCHPQNMLPEQSGRWFCEFPIPEALTTGAKIIITFPTGVNVANADIVPISQSWDNEDINGWGPGTTTITGTSTNTTANTVTLTLTHSGDAMYANDQLMFELKDIVNPASAGERNATAIVKNASGTKVGQTISFAPFNIVEAGAYSISGTVCKSSSSGGTCNVAGDDTAIASATIFLDSMMGMGHFETTTDAISGDFTFTGINNGDYGLGLHMDAGGSFANMGGSGKFQHITVSGANKTSADFKFTDLSSSGKTLTVNVTGAPASEEMDVFCHSMNNFEFSAPMVRKIVADAEGVASTTLKMQPNTTYECGMGPHIPFEAMTSGGPPPMPTFNFMPPPMQTVNIASIDKAISFNLRTTTEEIQGKVVDKDGNGIANAFIDAFPIGGKGLDADGSLKDMQGSFGKSKSDGTFAIKTTTGSYEVSACAPGMPCSPSVTVDVEVNDSSADNNSTADVYKKGTLVTGTGLSLKMAKSDVTIAGTVKDENGNPIKYAFVDAEQIVSGGTCGNFTPKGGFIGSPTDASGTYTLYVPDALSSATTYWRVTAHAPSYGQVACKIVTVEGVSKSGQTLQADANGFGSIAITSTKGGSATGGAFVGCYGPSGGNQGKTSSADGIITLKVPVGTYTCDGHLPGAGPLTVQSNISVTAGNTATTTLAVGNPGTINIDMGATMADDVVCSAFDANGRGDNMSYDGEAVDIHVPPGDYTISCKSPRTGQLFSDSVTVTAGETTSADKSADVPTLYTIGGRVTNGDGSNVNGATVIFTDQSNARKTFIQTSGASGTNNNASASLPAGTYSVQALKDGYTDDGRPQVLVVSANTSFTTRALTQAGSDNVSVTVQDSGSNYGGNAKVVATRSSDGKVMFEDVDNTVASGANVSMSLPDGEWTISAKGDNGKEDGTPATVTVDSGSADSSPTMALDTDITNFSHAASSQSNLNPSEGGLFISKSVTGLKTELDIVDSNDSTTGSIEMRKAPEAAIDTATSKVIGDAFSITPKNSSGREFSDASGDVYIPISTTELVSAGLISEGASATEIEAAGDTVSLGHLSDLGEWEALPTTFVRDANGSDNHSLYARTTSFSDFAPIIPADDAPNTPSGLAGTANSNTAITLTWTQTSGATSYDVYRDTSSSGSFPRLGSEPTVSSGSTTSYSDTGLTQNTTYYYKISAINNSGESVASSAVSVATKNEGGVVVGGGGGGGVSTPQVAGLEDESTEESADTTEEVVAEQVTVDTVAVAVDNLNSVANASYDGYTVSELTTEVSKTTESISTLVSGGELTATNVSTARSAIKSLLVGIIQVTLNKINVRIVELLEE